MKGKCINLIIFLLVVFFLSGCAPACPPSPQQRVEEVEDAARSVVDVYKNLTSGQSYPVGEYGSSTLQDIKNNIAVELNAWDAYTDYALDYLTGDKQDSTMSENPADAPVGSCEAVSGGLSSGADISIPDVFLPLNEPLGSGGLPGCNTSNRDGDTSSLSSYENGNAIERAFFESYNTGSRLPVELCYVVDGDTLAVSYGGEDYRVRLIGVNTEESVAREEYLESTGKENTEEGKQASSFVKDLLTGRETVWLEFDQELYDRYGRVLAYVYLDSSGTEMLQSILLQEGYAELMSIEPNVKYKEQLAAIAP